MVRRDYNLFVILIAVLFVTEAGAFSNINPSGGSSFLDASQSENVSAQLISQPYQVVGLENSGLAKIGKELAKPSIEFYSPITPLRVDTKPLPAIPATFFMVLAGFLCVSLVKDRKIWTAVLAGLLYFGLAGINMVPQMLTHHNIRKIKQSYSPKAICPRELENLFERQGDDEGTRYIGLLHRLTSIPDCDGFSVNQGEKSIAARGLACEKEISFSSALAIIQNMCRTALSHDCLAVKTDQLVCFSREFAFNYMPHGPPKIA